MFLMLDGSMDGLSRVQALLKSQGWFICEPQVTTRATDGANRSMVPTERMATPCTPQHIEVPLGTEQEFLRAMQRAQSAPQSLKLIRRREGVVPQKGCR